MAPNGSRGVDRRTFLAGTTCAAMAPLWPISALSSSDATVREFFLSAGQAGAAGRRPAPEHAGVVL